MSEEGSLPGSGPLSLALSLIGNVVVNEDRRSSSVLLFMIYKKTRSIVDELCMMGI